MQPRVPLTQRLLPSQRQAIEIVLSAGYGLLAWALFTHKVSPWPVALVLTVLVAVPLAGFRRAPWLAFAAALAGFCAAPVSPLLPFVALVPMGYVLYRVAGRYPLRVAVAALAVALAGAGATATTGHAGGVLPFAVVMVVAWTCGYAGGEHRRYNAELVRYHASAAEAARERAQRSAAEERIRIARELHDIVAHNVSVITVQAGYGHLVVDANPDKARAALAAIETTGRETLAEMRQLLGVLREGDDAELSPTPGLADLRCLIEQTTRAGVPVEITITGDPAGLTAGIELDVYRIVQEALTNVINHAGPTTAKVAINCHDNGVDVEVTDAGRGGPTATGGLGLVGMRERAERHGGRLHAAALQGGGFRVAATLRTREAEPVA